MHQLREMTHRDKWDLVRYKIRMDPLKYGVASMLTIALLFIRIQISRGEAAYYYIREGSLHPLLMILLIPALICILKYISYLLIFTQKRQIIDGHIYKKHKKEQRFSDGTWMWRYSARAISEDRRITTGWQYYPHKRFKMVNDPVMIVVRKGKGISFYLR